MRALANGKSCADVYSAARFVDDRHVEVQLVCDPCE